MRLPFVFVQLRSLVRELRALRLSSERIASALERAWPPDVENTDTPREEDFLSPADHGPDEQEAKSRILRAIATGNQEAAEALMEQYFSEDQT